MLRFKHPVLRVNDRDLNIAFYQDNLGLRLVYEENALAVFSAWSQESQSSFVIEESPAARTRAVNGCKKLNRIVLKTSAEAINQLLYRGVSADTIYRGKKGYAFDIVSPQGDRLLLHAEDDLTSLKESTRPQGQIDKDFKGLPDFTYTEIALNVLDPSRSEAFYQELFETGNPLSLQCLPAQGDDLELAPHIAWDIEILEYQVPQDMDLKALKDSLEAKGLSGIYLDKKEGLLVLSDPSQIEVWLSKDA